MRKRVHKSLPYIKCLLVFQKHLIFFCFQHRRVIRSITAAKYKEKQQVKDAQKLRKKEPKTILPHDPTADVFVTPAEEKPIEIQWVKPEPKVDLKARKKRVYKRQRKMKQKVNSGNAK